MDTTTRLERSHLEDLDAIVSIPESEVEIEVISDNADMFPPTSEIDGRAVIAKNIGTGAERSEMHKTACLKTVNKTLISEGTKRVILIKTNWRKCCNCT